MSSALEARALGVAGSAAEAASVAAARAGITVEKLNDLESIKRVTALFRSIWGPEDRDLIGVATLRALAHSENYLFGAFDGDEMVGAITGFVGWHDGALQLHSHILGVSSATQGKNVGFALKEHQRAWALSKEIATVTWTFDPLVSRNAYFNLTKLGASITSYFTSFYGPMNDGINGRDDSDRVLVVWTLDSPKAAEASTGNLKAPDLEMLTRSGAEVALKVDGNDRPVEMTASGDTILVGVPRDIVEIRRNDPDLAHLWRLATREVLSGALNDGYDVTAMTRSGYYVLERVK